MFDILFQLNPNHALSGIFVFFFCLHFLNLAMNIKGNTDKSLQPIKTLLLYSSVWAHQDLHLNIEE